jgi:ABC-2 type transport system ATP-binding protein
MSEPVIQIRGLKKTFHPFWQRRSVTAVDALDLDILPKEVFGLLGPNGSGKSTTIKMILGLLFPTHGTISVFGKHPTNVRVKRRIGFLPEETDLYPFLDARETLDFYARLFHIPRRERAERIDMLLDMVGLTSVAYRRVGEYSKGMQRRIGLAQALINDPDLLILDEPTSGLDPIGTRQFKDLISTLAERGKTVLLSSHLLADVEDVCDRVCILYGGRKQREGEVQELLAHRERTQITTDYLDEDAIAAVKQALSGVAAGDVNVSHPQKKLESLFLQIVEEARSANVTTGGATSGGDVAGFLRGEPTEGTTPEAVIDSLMASDTPDEPDTPEAPSDEQIARASTQTVVDDLVTAAPQPAPEQDDDEPAAPRALDTDLIDGLITKKGDE